MKKGVFIGFFGVLALLLGSCFSLPGASGSPLGSLQSQANRRINAEVASATGLTGMTRKMVFNMLYSQVFYIGGFGANYYPLAETEGTVWRLESTDEDGYKEKLDTERALLKKLPGGDEWWYLAWRSGDEAYEFEALMSQDQRPRKIRYYNADVKRVEEAVFKENAASGSDEEPPPAVSTINLEDLSAYSKGKERIRLNSGAYNAEKLEWSRVDEEEKTTYTYNWWVDPSTPGGLVMYEWVKSGSKEKINGELYSIKKGYTTRFSSF